MTRVTKEKDMIFSDLVSSEGSDEGSKVYTVTDIKSGKTEIVIQKTITERYPIQDYEKVMDLYERLSCGSGRKCWTLNEIAHPYNPKN